MIHLSMLSINPSAIAYIEWRTRIDHWGFELNPPAIAIAMCVSSGTHENLNPKFHYIPLDSEDAEILHKHFGRQMPDMDAIALIEEVETKDKHPCVMSGSNSDDIPY